MTAGSAITILPPGGSSADVPGFSTKKPGPPWAGLTLSGSSMSFDQQFSQPILLTDGRKLRTIRHAANYVTRLPKVEQDAPEWQAAAKALMLVGEHHGDPTLARIGVMKALHRNQPRPQSASRRRRA